MTAKGATYVPCVFRDGEPDDKGYIMKSWFEVHKKSPTHRAVPRNLYYQCQERVIKTALKRSFVIVACSPEDQSQIFGFIVCEPTKACVCVVHWIGVKSIYRRIGIGAALMREAKVRTGANMEYPVVFTHLSENFDWLKTKWDVVYNPYLNIMEIEDANEVEGGLLCQRRKVWA